MLGNILEISNKSSKNGRVPIKVALLKIHEDAKETNKNGLHWKKEYVLNALDSTKDMPFCAELDSEKEIPFGHGLTGEELNSNGVKEPIFENSVVVGVCENASIETIKDSNGNDIEAVCANGYLFNQRYPKFVKWIRKNYTQGNVDTSIEIMGTNENDNKIVYEEDTPTDKYRTPKEFVFSGSAFLGITPADDNAILLEISEKKQNKEEKINMDFNMDEIKTLIQNTISECNNKVETFTNQIAELNEQIVAKDAEIVEKDNKIVELNATVEQVQKALDDLKKEHETYWSEREALEKELGELKAKQRLGELNSAIENFSDDEKKYAEVEINSFNEDPMNGDIDAIVGKIYAGIGQASKKASEEAKIAETNSKTEVTVEDIFSEMCTEKHEDEEDLNIF